MLTRDYWRFFNGGYRYFLCIFYMSLRVISGSFFTCDIRSVYAANHACLRVIISVFSQGVIGIFHTFFTCLYVCLYVWFRAVFSTCDFWRFFAANHACVRMIIGVFFPHAVIGIFHACKRYNCTRGLGQIFYMSLHVIRGIFFPHVISGDCTLQITRSK